MGLALVRPITSRVKDRSFEVGLPQGLATQGVLLCDQIKSLDWRARRAKRLGSVPVDVVHDVTARILALLAPED